MLHCQVGRKGKDEDRDGHDEARGENTGEDLRVRPEAVRDIARRLLLETNTVTPLLQRMEKLGIVTRQRGKEDKRQQIVSLTEKGKAMEEQAYQVIPAGMGRELSACPFQLDDYERLAGELDTIINTLRQR